ncbi:hypothetical protein [Streptomyces sp. NPDC008001]|uniref:hypothetical protein n=1 Tax=Streptomyces sp. NPDC008001 TaxID=3364804 RepID=UPI0036F11D0B
MTGRTPMRRREPWPAAAQVLLRHVSGRRTWCALPVTVLHDGPDRAVLRIHEGTDWLAAFDRRGRRAHGWQRGWRLHPTTWRGDHGTYVIEWGRWYGTAVFSDPVTQRVRKWYVNCQDPLRRTAWGFDTMDRELDVELPASERSPRWKDTDRFRRLVDSGHLGRHTARIIVREARTARKQLTDPGVRDALARWATCRYDAPGLARTLAARPAPDDLARFAPGGLSS